MYLNCHTHFSLNYGTLSPEALVQAAKAKGVKALALTDINNVSGAFEFMEACKKQGIKPILGIEFRNEKHQLLYIGLAKNNQGWYELNHLLSQIDQKPLPTVPPKMEHVFILYPGLVKPLEHFRNYEFIGVRPEQVKSLFSSELKKHPTKLVALSPVTFAEAEEYELHKVLRAIGKNELISRLQKEDFAGPYERLFEIKRLLKAYELYPEIVQNTAQIVRDCQIEFKKDLGHNRRCFTGSVEEDQGLLRKLALEGFGRRYNKRNREAQNRVEKELKLIYQMGFTAYFLIVWDLIKYASYSNIFHVGRGSGANSIVAYCIGITDVDPIGLNLYFERFINEHRSSPPDFDVDFPSDQRPLILDYLFKRYGRHHTAFICTYDTFQFRSIVWELGKVFGLPKSEMEKIVANPQSPEEHHELARKIWEYGHRLENMPNELSVHPSGVIIAEQPLYHYSALRQMPFGFPIVHFDMYIAEDWGFNKFDILGQCGLSHIRDTVTYIRENQGKAVDVEDMEKIYADEKAKALLRTGDTVGVFYAESPNMRELLPKLQCDNYPDLVIASSIIRPGVASSGMMREYIQRHKHPYAFEYLHACFKEHLAETHGVMVFQEDVMKICNAFAGLSLGESDVLRKIMSGKRRNSETFEQLKGKFFNNSKDRGHPEDLAQEVWRQIESFAGYSFCKAHSAAFTVLSFRDLYLKAYYPLEFITAVINNFGGFYRTEIYLHEAKKLGATLHAPCVNHSEVLAKIEGENLYIGLVFIQGLEKNLAEEIVYQYKYQGPYKSLEDFINRVPISASQLELLIKVNAFRFTGLNKYQLMWEKNKVLNPKNSFVQAATFFESASEDFNLPELHEGAFDQAFDEIELLKFPLCSPFDLLDWDYLDGKKEKLSLANQLKTQVHALISILGYFICRKTTTTKQGQPMGFDAWYDQQGEYFNTVVFPTEMKQFPLKGQGIYLLQGKVSEEFGVFSIVLQYLERLPYRRDERFE
ncbi:DNA polymerase III subunit alpha [Haliscomenobacter sp.]|uniref:DNA polymerase III subunit alpha n=1 Tax=Haliscomenobacter sp. TaxID=2717303 RepID=UPI00359398FB